MPESTVPRPSPPGKYSMLLVTVLALACVVVPALFWHGTWFGRSLTADEMTEALNDNDSPRNIQHALVQVSERMNRGDAAARQWYPRVVQLADHPLAQLRLTAAWVMGQDAEARMFHDKLRGMLDDGDLLVRRNVALSLAAFRDSDGRPVLRAMLQAHEVSAPCAGILKSRLAVGDLAEPGTLLARVVDGSGKEICEVRAPLPGSVTKYLRLDGATLSVGEAVAALGPGRDHAYEALRALYLVGEREDLEIVNDFARYREDMSEKVARQAQATADEIRQRSSAAPAILPRAGTVADTDAFHSSL